MTPERTRLVIYRCRTHGFWSICADRDGHGVRLTPGKCCGVWKEVHGWDLDAGDWAEIERIAAEAQL